MAQNFEPSFEISPKQNAIFVLDYAAEFVPSVSRGGGYARDDKRLLTRIAPTAVGFAGKTPPLGVVWFVTRPLATHPSMGFRFKLIRRRLDVPADRLSRTQFEVRITKRPRFVEPIEAARKKDNARNSSRGHPDRRPMGYTAGDNRANQRRRESEERRVLA
jgi:hypothetical protein